MKKILALTSVTALIIIAFTRNVGSIPHAESTSSLPLHSQGASVGVEYKSSQQGALRTQNDKGDSLMSQQASRKLVTSRPEIRRLLESYTSEKELDSIADAESAIQRWRVGLDTVVEPFRSDLWDECCYKLSTELAKNCSSADIIKFISKVDALCKGAEIYAAKSLPDAIKHSLASAVSETDNHKEILKKSLECKNFEFAGKLIGMNLARDMDTAWSNLASIPIETRSSAEEVVLRNIQVLDRNLAANLFINSQTPMEYDEFTLQKYIGPWVMADPEAASSAINAAPPGPRKDWAIAEMIEKIAATSPYEAQVWASKISSLAVRQRAVGYLAHPHDYNKIDPNAPDIRELMSAGQ